MKKLLLLCFMFTGCHSIKESDCVVVMDGQYKGEFGYVSYLDPNGYTFIETTRHSVIITGSKIIKMPAKYCKEGL